MYMSIIYISVSIDCIEVFIEKLFINYFLSLFLIGNISLYDTQTFDVVFILFIVANGIRRFPVEVRKEPPSVQTDSLVKQHVRRVFL